MEQEKRKLALDALNRRDCVEAERLYTEAVGLLGDAGDKGILSRIVQIRREQATAIRRADCAAERVAHPSRTGTRMAKKLAASEFASDECVICRTGYPSFVMLPCRHRCVCISCAPGMNGAPCPLCRAVVERVRIWD